MPPYVGEFEQLVLLALLRQGENAYGVTVRKDIQKQAGRTITLGAVYKTLERLEAKGYIASRIGEPTASRGGRRKKYYSLKPLGVRALRQSFATLRRMAKGLGKELEAL